jgi:hypothetical protein
MLRRLTSLLARVLVSHSGRVLASQKARSNSSSKRARMGAQSSLRINLWSGGVKEDTQNGAKYRVGEDGNQRRLATVIEG